MGMQNAHSPIKFCSFVTPLPIITTLVSAFTQKIERGRDILIFLISLTALVGFQRSLVSSIQNTKITILKSLFWQKYRSLTKRVTLYL